VTRAIILIYSVQRRMISVVLSKSDVVRVEGVARRLMAGRWRGKRLPMLYYYILEDANFHSLNRELTKKGVFGEFETHQYPSGDVVVPKSRAGDDAEYREYRRLGGRTWEL